MFFCSPLLLPGTVSSKDRQEVLGTVLAQRPHQALRRGEGSLRSPEEVIPQLSCKGYMGRGKGSEVPTHLAGESSSQGLEPRIPRKEAGVAGGSGLSTDLAGAEEPCLPTGGRWGRRAVCRVLALSLSS